MASTSSIPRFLLPRGLPRTLHPHSTLLTIRHASSSSSTPPKKHTVLPQPDKFRPPSHPARRVAARQPRYYGPRLSEEELAAQKTKKYPNMMPPEGSFMYWFIHKRGLHAWIACGVLFSLATTMFIQNFKATSPFADMLPPPRQLLTSPITFFSQWLEIYKLHVEHNSNLVAEQRRRKVEDVQKRSQYRKAHGLEGENGDGEGGKGLFGWSAREKAPREEGDLQSPIAVDAVVPGGTAAAAAEGDVYVDFEGKKRPVKKWFGIW